MAVRILDETPDPRIVKRVSCGNCGSRLEYVPSDVRERHGTDYGGGPDGEKWVDCPKCGNKAVIESWQHMINLQPYEVTRPPEYDGDFREDSEASTRIAGTVSIGGRNFHYQAIEVTGEELDTAVNASLQKELDAIWTLVGDKPYAVEVDGRLYVECIFPFGQ